MAGSKVVNQNLDPALTGPMAHYTPIPGRPRADVHRIAIRQDDSMQNEVSVAELLHQLRARFDEDEIKARILHYPENVIDESHTAEEKEHVLPKEPLVEDPPRRRDPPIPTRPDESMLAQLLEISSDEWSDESYDDTTADSKLATWLASFTSPVSDASKSEHLNHLNTYPYSPKPLRDVTSNATTHTPGFTTPPRRSQVGQPGHTPWVNKRPSFRYRSVSEPRSPSSELSVTRPRSMSTHVEQSVKFVVKKGVNGNTPLTTGDLHPPFLSPFDFELESEASYATPNLYEANYTPTTPTTPILVTPIESKHSFANILSETPKLHSHDGPERRVRFSEMDDPYPPKGRDLSTADSFADISGIHAYNTALKHASKSPTMIRRWKHLLNEFSGRFAPSSHAPDFSQLIIEENEFNQLRLSSSTPIAAPADSNEALTDEEQASFDSQHFDLGELIVPKKTLADTILDREYASYLRKSIKFKQDEVRMLGELVKQRQKTIARLEETLQRRAIDVLSR